MYGILLADYYLVKQRQVKVEDLYTMRPEGRYWYTNGINRDAVKALVLAAAVCVACVMLPQLRKAADFSWFIGAALGSVFYLMFTRKR
jgi:NCS1 family nucleobase:cation symporter-1